MDFIYDSFPLKTAPLANSEYAWLHRLLKRYKSPKKILLTEDVEDVQGNEIAALDPSQEAEEVFTRSSKPVVQEIWETVLLEPHKSLSSSSIQVACTSWLYNESRVILKS